MTISWLRYAAVFFYFLAIFPKMFLIYGVKTQNTKISDSDHVEFVILRLPCIFFAFPFNSVLLAPSDSQIFSTFCPNSCVVTQK